MTTIINMVTLAKMTAIEAHGDQMYGGRPYKYHLQCVVDKVNFLYGESPKLKLLQQIAWDHDLLEDTVFDSTTLIEYGFSPDVVSAVVSVTKVEGESLSDYYDRVAKNKLGFKVKVADTLSNLEHSLREGMTKRIIKYTNQLQELYKRKGKPLCTD